MFFVRLSLPFPSFNSSFNGTNNARNNNKNNNKNYGIQSKCEA